MSHSTNFLVLIAAFVILLIVYFQGSKKRQQPSQMDFSKSTHNPVSSDSDIESTPSSLNLFFNYNGHGFDAYQVLGVPAGSSWNEVREAFERCLNTSDLESHEFYKAAFEAVKKQQKF